MLPYSGTLRWMVLAHIVCLVLIWLLPIVAYDSLPDRIPTHFNWQGDPDGWSDKSGIGFWSLPIVVTVLGIGALLLLRIPQHYGHPRKDEVAKLPREARENVYVILREMMMAVFLCVDLLMLVLMDSIIRSARSGQMTLSWWIFGFLMLLPIPLAGVYLRKVGRTIDRAKIQLS